MCRSIPPLWHIKIAPVRVGRTIEGSKSSALTAWLRRIMYLAYCVLLLHFWRAKNNRKVFMKTSGIIHWSKTSDLNCDSCSQSRRVTITPRSRYHAAGEIRTQQSVFQAFRFKRKMYTNSITAAYTEAVSCTASLVNVSFLLWCSCLIFCMVNHNTCTIYVWHFLTLRIFFQRLEKTLKLCPPSIVLYWEK